MAKKRKASRAKQPARRKAVAENVTLETAPEGEELASELEQKAKPDTGEDNGDPGDTHADAVALYEAGWQKDRENREAAYLDLKFLADVEEGQWEAKAKADRIAEGRPVLTVNKCPQFCRQVTGDIRQMRPAIHVVPVDDEASEDVAAKILPGMLRYVEQRSDAKASYFSAADQCVAAGIGHWRVLTEFAKGKTALQEIGIGLIEDGVAVVWDPDAIQPTRSDAEYCFVPVDMARKRFEKRWPAANASPLTQTSEAMIGWFTDDSVRVTEFWRRIRTKRKYATYPNGRVVDLTDDEDGAKLADAKASRPADPYSGEPGVEPATIVERDSWKVQRRLMTACDFLDDEPEEWDGIHIPIVPLMGEEVKIGRRIVRRGIIRTLQDVQRCYNYAISADAEAIALQPKSPFIGTKKNFEQFIEEWETANSRNWAFLQFTPDEANNFAFPQRVTPPVASTGIHELLMTTTADMSGVTGIYPSGLGQSSNETSGKAIVARQREGDTGTYHYIEAFGRAIQRTGEIIIDLIPHVYDTARVIRITGDDGKVDKLDLNKPNLEMDPNGDGQATPILNDVTVGCYEIAVEMGPSFSTKREEARDGMQALMTALGPEGAVLFADLYVKSQDFPLADKIAKRAESLLPPGIRAAEAKEAGEDPPEQPPAPQPTPEQQMLQDEAEKAHEIKQGTMILEGKQQEVDAKKIDAELRQVDADLEKARMTHAENMATHAANAAQAQADPRIDAVIDAVQRLQEAVQAIADGLGEHATKASDEQGKRDEADKLKAAEEKGAKKATPKAAPAPVDHMPAMLDLVSKLAERKTPTGVKRTKDGMSVTYDEPSPPGVVE